MKKKLTLRDVTIIGEGPQIRNYIKKSNISIKDFYDMHKEDMSIGYDRFRACFSKDYVSSDTFKCIITKLLNVDYNSLFVPIPKQFEAHIQSIYDNIREYNEEDDQLTFDYLLEQCKIHKEYLTEADIKISMLYRAKARNYFYINRIDRCQEAYEYAIDVLSIGEINRKVYLQAELADSLFRENKIDRAEKKYKHIETLIRIHKDKLDNNTLFYYHYWRGIAYMFSDKNAHAREFFKKAYEYAAKSYEKAGTIANVGLTLKRQGKYKEALKYYEEALNYCDGSRPFTTAEIYNYMSMLYKATKDYKQALEYIKRALDIAEKEDNLTYKLIYTSTNVEILMDMGNKEAYNSYFDLLLRTKDMHVNYKPVLLNSIKLFIESIDDIPCLNKLKHIIIELKDASSNIEYNDGLYKCLGHISYKKSKLNREVYDE